MSWIEFINKEKKKDYHLKISQFLENDKKHFQILPREKDIYNAFWLCDFNNTKVVILGQDPYPTPGYAHGLAFSTIGDKRPHSLSNIFKEIKNDLDVGLPPTNDLTNWAKQGVLLLNTCLTVRAHLPNSHKHIGWDYFIDNVFKELSKKDNLVYILLGKQAQLYEKNIKNQTSYIIKCAHPSPLSAHHGFFNAKPFSKCNDFLKSKHIKEINWMLNEEDI